jgi:tetratricopeptide (TPR) repeat protein
MSHKRKYFALSIVLLVGLASVGGLLFTILNSTDVADKLISLKKNDTDTSSQRKEKIAALKEIDQQNLEAIKGAAELAFELGRYIEASRHFAELYQLNPLETDALFKQAQSLYLGGQLADAQIQFNNSALNPYPETAVYRARLLLGEQKITEAETLLFKNLETHPKHAPTKLLLADIHLIKDEFIPAYDLYKSLLDTTQFASLAHFGISQVLLSQGKTDEAIKWQQQAPENLPNLQLDTAIAEFWRNMGYADKSKKLYKVLIAKYGVKTELAVAFAELLAIESDHIEIKKLRDVLNSADSIALAARNYLDAISSYVKKDYSATLQSLRWSEQSFGKRTFFRILELDSAAHEGDLNRFENAVANLDLKTLSDRRKNYLQLILIQHASTLLNRGNAEFSKSITDLASLLQPEDAAIIAIKARSSLLNRDYASAEKYARQLLERDQINTAALEVLTRSYYEMRLYNHALISATQLQKTEPDNAVGHYWEGIIHFRTKNYQQAEKSLQNAFDKGARLKAGAALIDTYLMTENYAAVDKMGQYFTGNNDSKIQALGHAYLAGSQRAQKQPSKAAEHYEIAAGLDNTRPVYLLSALDLNIEIENYSNASSLINRLKKTNADKRIVSFKEAYLQQVSGQNDQAILSYRQILREYPDWSLVMVNLSELLSHDASSLAEALKFAERSTSLTPDWHASWLNLSRIHLIAGNIMKANESAQKAITLKPDHQETKTLIEKIKSS